VIDYLMPSRFCPSDRFNDFVMTEFDGLSGGACVTAIRDWVAQHLTYQAGASHGGTCASDTFIQRRGVCRDYAHLLITLARAASIPARYASVYAPDVDPPDFHAVAEVFLGGVWHLVDATGMAAADEVAKIGVGRDAADIPFLSSFGNTTLIEQVVSVSRIG
jgi:transglutaminase-like putative cysteine protease